MTIQMILIALVLGVLTGFLVAGALKSQLKTVNFQNAANNYVLRDTFHVTHSSDHYLYSNVVRTPKPKDNGSKK